MRHSSHEYLDLRVKISTSHIFFVGFKIARFVTNLLSRTSEAVTEGCGTARRLTLLCPATRILFQEFSDMLVEKFQIRGAGARSCRMSLEGRYRQQTAVRNELSFVSGIRNREIEVCFRWHVEHPRPD
jgi:hypothetical protein